VWIATALFLGSVIGLYDRMVERADRSHVILGTCTGILGFLVLFAYLLGAESAVVAVAFYIFVDIFSVVMVEQFWSLTDTLFETDEGKRWYGFITTGGLLGGVLGGEIASLLLEHTPLHTRGLLLVAAGILALVIALNLIMTRLGVFREAPSPRPPIAAKGGWRALAKSRYLLLIAAILLFSQFAQPLVEFQFIKTIESHYQGLDERTAYLSSFFAFMGLFSIAVNLSLTPLIHRFLGVIAGLTAQPLMLLVSSLGFLFQPGMLLAAGMKISDRGLSYSINRASKELLYVPVDPVHTYQAKAWIDMFGYRLFKVLGSVLILALTQWLPLSQGAVSLGWFTVGCCLLWLFTLVYLRREYLQALQPAHPL
jgi:AAA family ATP:ADP antiporter